MKLLSAALVALLPLSSAAQAACPTLAAPILSCSLKDGAKQLEVCLEGDSFTYAYGPRGGSPELRLYSEVADGSFRPWNGIGRTIWEVLVFRNGEYFYEVGMGWDKMAALIDGEDGEAQEEPDPGVAMSAGIDIQRQRPGQEVEYLAFLECDPGSILYDTDRIYRVYDAAGLCWDHGERRWTNTCQN